MTQVGAAIESCSVETQLFLFVVPCPKALLRNTVVSSSNPTQFKTVELHKTGRQCQPSKGMQKTRDAKIGNQKKYI